MENTNLSTDKENSQDSKNTASLKAQLFYQIVSYIIIIFLCVILFFVANELPPSRWEPLGASAFPKIILSLIIFICALTLVSDSRKMNTMKDIPLNIGWNPKQNLVLFLFILLGLYLGLTPLFGFKLSTFVFLMAAQLLLGPKTKKTFLLSIIIALVFSVGMYALFENAFNIYLPRSSILQ